MSLRDLITQAALAIVYRLCVKPFDSEPRVPAHTYVSLKVCKHLVPWPLDKNVPIPPINRVHLHLPDQPVLAQIRQHLCPDHPVHAARRDDPDAHHTVGIVRQAFIDVLALRRGNKGRNDEVDVGQCEEDGDRKGSAERRIPAVGFAVKV